LLRSQFRPLSLTPRLQPGETCARALRNCFNSLPLLARTLNDSGGRTEQRL
jgi:hypothetical protein